jgi:hypothetical protein
VKKTKKTKKTSAPKKTAAPAKYKFSNAQLNILSQLLHADATDLAGYHFRAIEALKGRGLIKFMSSKSKDGARVFTLTAAGRKAYQSLA